MPPSDALAAAGPAGGRWPRGRPVRSSRRRRTPAIASTASRAWAARVFRVVTVPLHARTARRSARSTSRPSLDRRYAAGAGALAGARTAIVSDGLVLASTLVAARGARIRVGGGVDARRPTARSRSTASRTRSAASSPSATPASTRSASIDESSRAAMRDGRCAASRSSPVGATLLALLGSFWLARLLTEPIGQLSTSLAAMAASHDVTARLPLDRLEPRARHAHRHVQRADGVGRGRRGADAGAPTRAPFARSRRRSTRAIRTRPAIPSASACCRSRSAGRSRLPRRGSRSPPAGRAAARHRQDRRARRRCCGSPAR